MEFTSYFETMSESIEGSLPSYSEIKDEYPDRMEVLEDSLKLHSDSIDPEDFLSNSIVPEILSDVKNSDFSDLVAEYDESKVFEMIDYGLLKHDLDGVELSTGGEEYLEIFDDMNDKNTKFLETNNLENSMEHLYIPKEEIENSFSRYESNLETIRNVFEGRDSPEEHIRWDELPETLEEFSDEPEWYSKRSQEDSKGPDWINNKPL